MAAKSKIFSFVRVSENSMVASVRIANMISKELNIPIVTDASIAHGKLDVLLIVNGAYAFSKHLADLGEAVENAKTVVWVQNDYTIIPPKPDSGATSPFRKAFVNRRQAGKPDTSFWSTCEDWAKMPGSQYVNWNCLTFDIRRSDEQIRAARKENEGDLFYYGSWRVGSGRSSREKYFDRYFLEPKVRTVVSSPAKQFAERYKDLLITIEPKIEGDLSTELAKHGLGLYIEDRMSHEHFHSPANRFYEMLSAGLPMVFQPECGSSLRKGGYDPSMFLVERPLHVQRAMDRSEVILKQQREMWLEKARNERLFLPKKLKEVYSNHLRSL